ncbi:unnamed protein product, partial [Tenebrio molitor]
RPNFRQLSDFEPGRIVVLREGGLSFRQIAARLNRSVSAVDENEPDVQDVPDKQQQVKTVA